MESFSDLTANAGAATSLATSPFPFSSFDPEYAEPHDRRVLVVDDEESVRNLYASYLNETYSCATAGDAKAALELMASEQFALVLSDIQMPGLSGTELLRKIVERYPDTAGIIIFGGGPPQPV